MKIKVKFVLALLSVAFLVFAVSPAFAVDPGQKLDSVGKEVGLEGDFPVLTGKVISGILAATSLIFLIMIFYAGFLWLIAQGEAAKIQKAKTLMTYSVLGLVIMFLAYAITYFVFSEIIPGSGPS